MNANQRSLTPEMRQLLIAKCQACPWPSYVNTAMTLSLNWKSFSDFRNFNMPAAVNESIMNIIENIEQKYGKILVQRLLIYITLSRKGLTEAEIEDILSCDDEVLREIYSDREPIVHRLPTLLWIRVRNELLPFFDDASADGFSILRWKFRNFADVVRKKYLSNTEDKIQFHSALADYFSDKWKDGKPFERLDRITVLANRLVMSQPAILSFKSNDVFQPTFNLRKLSELPYHLLCAQRYEQLKELLCNFLWLLSKLTAASIHHVLNDFDMAISCIPGSQQDLKLVRETLIMSLVALNDDPAQLASQLIGRLATKFSSDGSSYANYRYVNMLLQQAADPPVPSLIPPIHCASLTPPGGSLSQLLSGHTGCIHALTTSANGHTIFSASWDKTIKLWDARTGSLIGTMEGLATIREQQLRNLCNSASEASDLREIVSGLSTSAYNKQLNKIWSVGKRLSDMKLCCQDRFLVTTCWNVVQLWRLDQMKCVVEFASQDDIQYRAVCIANVTNKQVLVTYDEREMIIHLWNIEKFGQSVRDFKSNYHNMNTSWRISGAYENLVMFINPSQTVMHVFNVANGETVHRVQIPAATMYRSLITANGRILITNDVDSTVSVWDIRSAQCLGAIKATEVDEISFDNTSYAFLSTNNNYYMITNYLKNSNIHKYDLSTLERSPFSSLPVDNISTFVCSPSYVITAAHADPRIFVWDTKRAETTAATESTFCPNWIQLIGNDEEYVVAYQKNMSSLTIWYYPTLRLIRTLTNVTEDMFHKDELTINKDVLVLRKLRDLIIYDFESNVIVNNIRDVQEISSDFPYLTSYSIIGDDRIAILPRSDKAMYIIKVKTGGVVARLRKDVEGIESKEIVGMMVNSRRTVAVLFVQFEMPYFTELIVWNFRTFNSTIFHFDHKEQRYSEFGMSCLSPDGHYLAYRMENRCYVNLLCLTEGKVKAKLFCNADVRAINMTSDKLIVSYGSSGNIGIWNLVLERWVHTLIGHVAGISRIVLTPDCRICVTVADGLDCSVRMWDVMKHKQLSVFTSDVKIYQDNIALNNKGDSIILHMPGMGSIMTLRLVSPDSSHNNKITENKNAAIDNDFAIDDIMESKIIDASVAVS